MNIRAQTLKALTAFSRQYGHPAMRQLIEENAGVSAMSEIPDDKLDDVLRAACDGAGVNPSHTLLNDDRSLNAGAIYARWNGAKRRTES